MENDDSNNKKNLNTISKGKNEEIKNLKQFSSKKVKENNDSNNNIIIEEEENKENKKITLPSPTNHGKKEYSKNNYDGKEDCINQKKYYGHKTSNSIETSHFYINKCFIKGNNFSDIKSNYPKFNRLIFINRNKSKNLSKTNENFSPYNSNDSNKFFINTIEFNKPREILINNLPYFENYFNQNNEAIITMRIVNPDKKLKTKREYQKLPPIEKLINKNQNPRINELNSSNNLRKIKLNSIAKKEQNHRNEKANVNTEDSIKIGGMFHLRDKDPEADERNKFNEKLKLLFDENKNQKNKIKEFTPKNCNDYLKYAKNKKISKCRELVEETIETALSTKSNLIKLFDDIKKKCNQYDDWNDKKNIDNLFDK